MPGSLKNNTKKKIVFYQPNSDLLLLKLNFQGEAQKNTSSTAAKERGSSFHPPCQVMSGGTMERCLSAGQFSFSSYSSSSSWLKYCCNNGYDFPKKTCFFSFLEREAWLVFFFFFFSKLYVLFYFCTLNIKRKIFVFFIKAGEVFQNTSQRSNFVYAPQSPLWCVFFCCCCRMKVAGSSARFLVLVHSGFYPTNIGNVRGTVSVVTIVVVRAGVDI